MTDPFDPRMLDAYMRESRRLRSEALFTFLRSNRPAVSGVSALVVALAVAAFSLTPV